MAARSVLEDSGRHWCPWATQLLRASVSLWELCGKESQGRALESRLGPWRGSGGSGGRVPRSPPGFLSGDLDGHCSPARRPSAGELGPGLGTARREQVSSLPHDVISPCDGCIRGRCEIINYRMCSHASVSRPVGEVNYFYGSR